MDTVKMHQQLMDRLAENYGDYRANLLLKDRQELIDDASKIAGTAKVFRCLTERAYDEQELTYLLNFQNPLAVVADRWTNEEFLLDALDAVVRDIVDKEAELTDYPLAADVPEQKAASRVPSHQESGEYAREHKEMAAMREQPERAVKKPSIKAQLAAKPVPGDKPAAKAKDREVR